MTPEPRRLSRIIAFADETIRLSTAGTVGYFTLLKCVALSVLWIGGALVVGALALLPPALARHLAAAPALRQGWGRLLRLALLEPKLWLAGRHLLLRWPMRAGFCAAMAYFTALPIHHYPIPENARLLMDTSLYPAYDATLGPEGKALYVAHAHAQSPPKAGAQNGYSRIDLTTGDVQTRILNNEHAHYLEIFPEHGFFIINAYLKHGPEHSIGLEKAGHLYYVHLKSLLRLRELDCPIVYPIRSYRLRDGSILMVNKEASELLKASDPTRPCSDDATVIPLRGEVITPTEANPHPDTFARVLGLEHLAFHPEAPDLAWATGEFGGDGCLVDTHLNQVLTCPWFGIFVWATAVEPGANRLWVARSAHHRIDLRDARTGELQGTLATDGVPRPMAFDPDNGLAFVGMYFSGTIAIIDVETLEVLANVGAGSRIRRLLMNPENDALIAVSSERILSYPLESLRRLAREAPVEIDP